VLTLLGDRSGRRLLPVLLGLGLAVAYAHASGAEEIEDESPIEEERGTLGEAQEEAAEARELHERIEIGLYPTADFYPAMHFGEFDANAYQPGGRLRITMPVAPRAALRLVVRGSALLTGFSDVSQNLFDPGGPKTGEDPYGNLYQTSVQLQGGWRSPWKGLFSDDETWTLVGEGFARSRWEEGFDFGKAIDGGGAVGVGYQVGEWLEILAGAGVTSRRFRGGVGIFPVVEITWDFAPGWQLRQRGRGGEIQYEIDEDTSVFVMGGLYGRSYRLAERPGGVGEGRLRDKYVPVGLGVRWDARPGVELTLTAGALIEREIRIQNESRQDLGHVRSGPSPFVTLQIELRPDRLARREPALAQAQGETGAVSSSSSTSRSR
jgi:hypothetical protein